MDREIDNEGQYSKTTQLRGRQTMEDLYKRYFSIEQFKKFDIAETAASISHRLLEEAGAAKRLCLATDIDKLTGTSAYITAIEAASISHRSLAEIEAVKYLGSAMELEKLTGISAFLAASEAASMDYRWLTEVEAAKCIISKIDAVNSALYSHVDSISKISLLAQERIDSAQSFLRESTIYNTHEMENALKSFRGLTSNYNSFVNSFDTREIRITDFPPFVSRLPPIEILTSSCLLETISRIDIEDDNDQAEPVESEIREDIEHSLEELLDWFDPKIRQLLYGAKEAFTSNNPDKNRHVVVSLREMITHILHGIAPDNKVHEWTKEPSHYHEGRPTRKARMLYVCRDITHGKFAEFLNEDVKSHIKFIEFFQSCTHAIDVKVTNLQLKTLIIRTEALARFLLVTARSTK